MDGSEELDPEKLFTVTANKVPSDKKGYIDHLLVDIYDNRNNTTIKIGEYKRNYSTLFNTWLPFERDGKFYALYSPNYTATRVMSLPDCIDIGGEEPQSFGFCPTGYYVPEITIQKGLPDPSGPQPYNPRHDPKRWARVIKTENGTSYDWKEADKNNEYKELVAKFDEEIKHWYKRHPFITITAPFGFVCGCHWGDDTSWKIEHLDLSRVADGVIVRSDRMGYIEMVGGGDDLKNCISVSGYSYDHQVVTIAVAKQFDLSKHIGDDERAEYAARKEALKEDAENTISLTRKNK